MIRQEDTPEADALQRAWEGKTASCMKRRKSKWCSASQAGFMGATHAARMAAKCNLYSFRADAE